METKTFFYAHYECQILIESNMEDYYAATRRRKAELAWGIIREVERMGGRFLKWHDRGWWTKLEDRPEVR